MFAALDRQGSLLRGNFTLSGAIEAFIDPLIVVAILYACAAWHGERLLSPAYMILAGQSHLHVMTPSNSARNSSTEAASMRFDLMLALRVVLSRSRFITMWRTMARLLAA